MLCRWVLKVRVCYDRFSEFVVINQRAVIFPATRDKFDCKKIFCYFRRGCAACCVVAPFITAESTTILYWERAVVVVVVVVGGCSCFLGGGGAIFQRGVCCGPRSHPSLSPPPPSLYHHCYRSSPPSPLRATVTPVRVYWQRYQVGSAEVSAKGSP